MIWKVGKNAAFTTEDQGHRFTFASVIIRGCRIVSLGLFSHWKSVITDSAITSPNRQRFSPWPEITQKGGSKNYGCCHQQNKANEQNPCIGVVDFTLQPESHSCTRVSQIGRPDGNLVSAGKRLISGRKEKQAKIRRAIILITQTNDNSTNSTLLQVPSRNSNTDRCCVTTITMGSVLG